MSKKLHDIPSMDAFMKGLEKIREQQLEARETGKMNVYPFEGNNGQYSEYQTGIITPKDQHYLISAEGDISFTGTEILSYEGGKDAFPPFSCAEMLLESKDDFKIDYQKAAEYYSLNKELAIKENEQILSSKEFKPEHPITLTVNQGMQDVTEMLEKQGVNPSGNEEVTALLDKHFSKIEKLLSDFTENVEKSSFEKVPELEKSLKEKLNKIFSDLKMGLKQLFVDMKDQVQSGIENKIENIQTNIHNAVASRVQNVNDKIKNFTNAVDQKFQVIDRPKTDSKELEVNFSKESEIPMKVVTLEQPKKEEQQKKESVQDVQKEEIKKLLLPYAEELREKYGDIGEASINSNDDKNFNITFSKENPLGPQSFYRLKANMETGKVEFYHSFPDSRNENWFQNVETLEVTSLDKLRSRELENISPQQDELTVEKPDSSLSELKKEINHLKKENEGLKTFVNVIKSKNPEVFKEIINTMKGVDKEELNHDTPVVKEKVVEEIQL
ncbi:hypothetical protein [Bacillus massiliglaciei]|uniref:hypothetical protein n=1 Tax=Bacillus massiliglaciei TaxID=1816693 RepID=UPI000DA60F20|nr:hypothetical protein [Bacillus massiliglaciei]